MCILFYFWNEMNETKIKLKKKIIPLKGAQIPQFEAGILQELENQLKKEFTLVHEVKGDTTMGFTVENKRVTEIGLYKCELSNLPESIGNLKSLQDLLLDGNKLTTLPESIGKLKSLNTLLLGNNQLTTLPKSIVNLSKLERLRITDNPLVNNPNSKVKSLLKRLTRNGVRFEK